MLKFKEFSSLLEDLASVKIDKEEIGKIEKDDIPKVKQAVSKLSSDFGTIKEKIRSFGFLEKDIENIIHEISDKDDLKKFSEFLDNRISLSSIGNRTQLQSVFSESTIGLGQSTIDELFKLLWDPSSNKPKAGPGELALSLFIEGGKFPKSGDVEIDNKKYEVKAAKAAMLGQKIPAGNGKAMREAFYNGFESILKNRKYSLNSPNWRSPEYVLDAIVKNEESGKNEKIKDAFGPKTSSFWNFSKGRANAQVTWGIEIVSKVILSQNPKLKSDIIDVISSVLNSYWANGYKSEFAAIFNNQMDEVGNIQNKLAVLQEMAALNYRAYSEAEKHEAIFLLNGSGKGKTAKSTTIIGLFAPNELDKAIKGGLIDVSGLSFTDSAARSTHTKFMIK